ncbi:MAG: protein of unknown function phage head/tail component [Clostridiaceae bacterium]|nr:protein of unknown function phage head/tail component [Clostridiaceae bacterium]
MAKWGKCDFSQFIKMRDRFQQLQTEDLQTLAMDLTNEIASRLFARIVKRTPVGQYPSGSGKVGGTLRRGWTIGEIQHIGNMYQIEIINPTEYAIYVEYGHRTANHKGWVRGRFMMTISEKEINNQMPKIIQKRITEYLEWCMNGK